MLLAHLSDPHIGPLPRPRFAELMGKRVTGYVNWRRNRHDIHDVPTLEALVADLLAQAPDHSALTGDLVNLGLAAEFAACEALVKTLGAPDAVSVVPGNHDAYVSSSLAHMTRLFAPWMTGDGEAGPTFPYLRERAGVALIGLSSAIATGPFLASGEVGRRQMAAFAHLLREARAKGLPRVVMIHHPPHRAGASYGRGLRDAESFERVIRAAGAELVIHGHNHRRSIAHLPGPDGPVPVVGVASASAVPGSPDHRAAYHLFRVGEGPRPAIRWITRSAPTDSGRFDQVSEQDL